jgi:predicted nucleic acid-binding protein
LRFVIDSNEYIFAFGPLKEPVSFKFLEKLLETGHSHTVRIPRTIFEEVKRNLSPESFREFISFINALTTIDEDIVVPFEIAIKYEAKGLKPADAFIAAFTEWVGAEVLVTENRHFLSRHTDLPFEVLTAEECLKLI